MASQRAVCIVRNESLTKEVFVVEPDTPVEEFKKMVVAKFQQEEDELDMFLQNSICPLLSIDFTLPTMSETGLNFDPEARNNIMLLPKKIKKTIKEMKEMQAERIKLSFEKNLEDTNREITRESLIPKELRADFVGLVNQSNTCYLNCLLQILYMTPKFRNAVFDWQFKDDAEADKCIAIQLQKLFILLQTSRRSAINTTEFTGSFGWSQDHAKDQQDIQELFTVLFDTLRKSLKKYELTDIIDELYEGKSLDFIKCKECNNVTSKKNVFIDIQLPLKNADTGEPHTNIEEALKGYITPEDMLESNQYFCENCNKKCDGQKGLKFTHFPEVLNLLLMRFDFDMESKRGIKLDCRIEFPNNLDLANFISSQENMDNPCGENGISPVTDQSPMVYELYAVTLHSGTAFAGHYYAYIKDLANGEWLSFNDQKVTKIAVDRLELAYGEAKKSTFSTNAYMLTYRKVENNSEQPKTKKDFSEYTQALMLKYLEKEGQKFMHLSFNYKPQDSDVLQTKEKILFNKGVTVNEVISSAKDMFDIQDIPVEQCRFVSSKSGLDKRLQHEDRCLDEIYNDDVTEDTLELLTNEVVNCQINISQHDDDIDESSHDSFNKLMSISEDKTCEIPVICQNNSH